MRILNKGRTLQINLCLCVWFVARKRQLEMAAHSEINEEQRVGSVETVPRGYLLNRALFGEFYSLQKRFTDGIAGYPVVVRIWLNSLPHRDDPGTEGSGTSNSWRTARLSSSRRRNLSDLIVGSEGCAAGRQSLSDFLLTALPVELYFAIAEAGASTQIAFGADFQTAIQLIAAKRNELFAANYGLAKVAVRGRKNYDELLSPASIGLLAAIDRYVPNEATSARFGYFANFWIRYHVSRYSQKTNGVVPLSINQQRIVRKIERFFEQCRGEGRPAPTEFEICSALQVSAEAYRWYLQRPVVLSLDQPASPGAGEREGEATLGNVIAAEEPEPDQILEDSEIGRYVRELLRNEVPAHVRVMLAYARRVGSLCDAGEDHLLALEGMILARVRSRARASVQGEHAEDSLSRLVNSDSA